MAWLHTADFALFQLINHHLGNPVFDFALPLFREKWFWAPLYVYILAWVWQHLGTRRVLLFTIGVCLAVGTADFTSSTIVKKTVQRLRPCNDPQTREAVVLRAPCGSGYSFTSSHAANHFAFAVFVGMALGRRFRHLLLAWATLVALAQVYVGVHYPLDVLGGALLGVGLGYLFGKWYFLRMLPVNNFQAG